MNLNELRDKIHENAKSKGFYDREVNAFAKACNLDVGADAIKSAFFAQKIALILNYRKLWRQTERIKGQIWDALMPLTKTTSMTKCAMPNDGKDQITMCLALKVQSKTRSKMN